MFGSFLYITILLIKYSVEEMEPYIVGGEPAKIQYYSHSAFLSMESYNGVFVCGSSILNQNVLLSAAHCFEDAEGQTKVTVRAGSSNKLRGALRTGSRIAVHKDYNANTVENDIALVYVRKPFILGTNIKRIILMKYPPSIRMASVAGWGLVDERKNINTDWLHHTQQILWSRDECKKILNKIPHGSICGGTRFSGNYASSGDSGSALIINEFIQIGLVSFKRPEISRGLVVYTDVTFYYDWIMKTNRRLFC